MRTGVFNIEIEDILKDRFPVLDYTVWFWFYTKPRLRDLIIFVFKREERNQITLLFLLSLRSQTIYNICKTTYIPGVLGSEPGLCQSQARFSHPSALQHLKKQVTVKSGDRRFTQCANVRKRNKSVGPWTPKSIFGVLP